MRQLDFYKLQAAGNDFILIDARAKASGQKLDYKNFAKKYCQRKSGIGADGVLVIEPSSPSGEAGALFRMRIFNADGSEAEMCGNGARCAGLWAMSIAKITKQRFIQFETLAGIIGAALSSPAMVKVKTTDPFDLKLNVPLAVLGRDIHINYINTGVPHVVIFVQGLEGIHVDDIGRAIRYHRDFAPQGTNVNFVEMREDNLIAVRTYERGVEAETLACGTGSVASAIITHCTLEKAFSGKIKQTVMTKSGTKLTIYFQRDAGKIFDVWLEGEVVYVYRGSLTL